MTKFFTRILLIIAGAMLIACTLFAQNNTNTRQIRFFPVVTAADTAATSANQGRMWYDFTSDNFRANRNGTNFSLGSGGGGGGSFWATTGTTNVTTPTINGSVLFATGSDVITASTKIDIRGASGANAFRLADNLNTERFLVASSGQVTITPNVGTFDGVTINATSSGSAMAVSSSANDLRVALRLRNSNGGTSPIVSQQFWNNNGAVSGSISYTGSNYTGTLFDTPGANAFILWNHQAGPLYFGVNNTRAMMIGSSGITQDDTKDQIIAIDATSKQFYWRDVATIGGIGGSTGSADNFIPRSDGTGGSTLQPSDIFVSDNAVVTALGNSSSSTGTQRIVMTDGTETNIDLEFRAKKGGSYMGIYANASSNSIGFHNQVELVDIVFDATGANMASTGHFHIESQNGDFTLESVDDLYLNAPTGNLGLHTSAGSFGSGTGVTFIANATLVPSTDPTGGAIMYAEGGALKARGSSGTVTTFAPADPHCPVCGSDFVCEYENEKYGYLAMCFKCMAENMNKPKRKRKPFFTTTKGAWSTHK